MPLLQGWMPSQNKTYPNVSLSERVLFYEEEAFQSFAIFRQVFVDHRFLPLAGEMQSQGKPVELSMGFLANPFQTFSIFSMFLLLHGLKAAVPCLGNGLAYVRSEGLKIWRSSELFFVVRVLITLRMKLNVFAAIWLVGRHLACLSGYFLVREKFDSARKAALLNIYQCKTVKIYLRGETPIRRNRDCPTPLAKRVW